MKASTSLGAGGGVNWVMIRSLCVRMARPEGAVFCAALKGEGGIEHLAKATGASVRTLQRRLKDAGVNYNDLQNDVRKTLALNLLENETLALTEIAFSLGYSEVSAFNHAFRRWVGQSPGHYRRRRAPHFKSAAKKS